MRLSKFFKLFLQEYYNCDNRRILTKYNMLIRDFNIESYEPLEISGRCSLLDSSDYTFEDIDIQYKEKSFFVFDEIGHSGEWRIREFSSIEDVERLILSKGGYLNMFCTAMIVLQGENILRFKIYYKNSENKIAFIDKDNFDDNFNDLKVLWIQEE